MTPEPIVLKGKVRDVYGLPDDCAALFDVPRLGVLEIEVARGGWTSGQRVRITIEAIEEDS